MEAPAWQALVARKALSREDTALRFKGDLTELRGYCDWRTMGLVKEHAARLGILCTFDGSELCERQCVSAGHRKWAFSVGLVFL